MEQAKHNEPMFSEALRELAVNFKVSYILHFKLIASIWWINFKIEF
jgi:hypothetical protein